MDRINEAASRASMDDFVQRLSAEAEKYKKQAATSNGYILIAAMAKADAYEHSIRIIKGETK